MLVKPSIRNSIQMEVSEARQLFDPHELTKPYLDHLRSESPQMTALMHEALRCYTASSSIRLTLAPVPIGKRVIPTNSVVLVPFRPLHYDEEVFGSDVNTFNPDRFVKNKGLSNSQNFKPFSAGSSYCPGRKLATMEFIGFVAEMLGAYDVEVVGEMKVPSADERTPTKGIVLPIETEDLTLRISRKR
jgi:cytochrome P450